MAERKTADDDFDPRHRIVGAVVLVTLAVIFLPLFLRSQPSENNPPTTDRPGAETRVVTKSVPPLSDATPTATKPVETATAVRTVTSVVPVAEPVGEKPVEEAAPETSLTKNDGENKTSKSTKAAASKATSPAGKGWTVQVGLFTHAENVARLRERLRQKGYSVMVDPPAPTPGKPSRVEVGPYRDAASAKAALVRLHDEFSIEGVVRKP